MPRTRLRLVLIFVAVLLVGALAVFALPRQAFGPGAQPAFPPPQVTFTPPALEDLAAQYPRLARLLRDPDVDSAYKDFVVAYEQGGLAAAEQLARTRGLLTPDNHIRVTLVVDTTQTALLIEDLRALGVNVLGAYQDLIDISIPLPVIAEAAQSSDPAAVFERIRDLEHVVGLEFSPPTVPRGRSPAPRVQAEEIVSEGVSAIQADAWHSAGHTGRAVKIGVLDQGFDGYRDLLGRELPDRVEIRSFVSGVEPDATGVKHGAAVAEILHDVAPDAELVLAYYDGGDVSMGNAVEWLLEQGVNIITHSAGGLAGPMDGTGRDAELADRAAAQGVLWINSAGNSAAEHLRADYADADGDGYHDFHPDSPLLAFRPVPDQMTQVVLNWDDWPQADEDYDLYLFDRDGVVLASSRNVQAGNRSPIEQILYRFDDAGTYYVAVQAVQTSRPAQFDLYVHEARSMEHSTPSHSLTTPADARGALAVGAADYRDGTLETFSSYGPTRDGRIKPELVGPDGVSTASYGKGAFLGTSAAAPHVAGAAALVWSAYPQFTADEVHDYLLSNTVPVEGNAEPDAVGFGRLRLPAPPTGPLAARPTPFATRPIPSSPGPAGSSSIGSLAAICFVGAATAAVAMGLTLRRRQIGRSSRTAVAVVHPVSCPTCGAQASGRAQFCSQCGRPIDASARRTCVRCGSAVRPGAAYCSQCGAAN